MTPEQHDALERVVSDLLDAGVDASTIRRAVLECIATWEMADETGTGERP